MWKPRVLTMSGRERTWSLVSTGTGMIGGFVASFVFAEIISVSGLYLDLEWGYVLAFGFFIAMMFAKPQGLLARRA